MIIKKINKKHNPTDEECFFGSRMVSSSKLNGIVTLRYSPKPIKTRKNSTCPKEKINFFFKIVPFQKGNGCFAQIKKNKK